MGVGSLLLTAKAIRQLLSTSQSHCAQRRWKVRPRSICIRPLSNQRKDAYDPVALYGLADGKLTLFLLLERSLKSDKGALFAFVAKAIIC